MSLPDRLARTLANNRTAAKRARLTVSKLPEGLPSPLEMVKAIDAVLDHGNFYTQAAQDAVAGLIVARDRFAAAIGKT